MSKRVTTRTSSASELRNRATALTEGYLHPAYAASLADFGTPVQLRACGGWLLIRDIPGTRHQDAMSPYPLFCCRDWRAVARDLHDFQNDLVSVTVVTDPAEDYSKDDLQQAFDRVQPFKRHYLVDTDPPLEESVSKSHQRLARRALKDVQVELCEQPVNYLNDWMKLYATLAQRHGVTGMRAFSRQAFATQLAVPGMTMFRAVHDGETIGMDLWYLQDGVAQGHLVAFSERGYKLRASYATKWTMLQYFYDKVRYINLGGLSGSGGEDENTGLAHFKKGWANTTRTAFLCGRVLNPDLYRRLAGAGPAADYFPAYRAGEFS